MSDIDKIKILTKALKNESSVEFKYNGFYHQVFESSEGGYVVNVYSNSQRDEYGELLDDNIVDDGLCTGSAKDAIKFML